MYQQYIILEEKSDNLTGLKETKTYEYFQINMHTEQHLESVTQCSN